MVNSCPCPKYRRSIEGKRSFVGAVIEINRKNNHAWKPCRRRAEGKEKEGKVGGGVRRRGEGGGRKRGERGRRKGEKRKR